MSPSPSPSAEQSTPQTQRQTPLAATDSSTESPASPVLAYRQDSRRSLLAADPAFSQQRQPPQQYQPPPQQHQHQQQQYQQQQQQYQQQQQQYQQQQQQQQYPQPPYQQPQYQQPPPRPSPPQQQPPVQSYNGGYHYRDGFAPSNPNSLRRSKMDFIATKWPKAFMATATIQAIICLIFEA